MVLDRRSFFRGAALLIAAPAIVRASSLMPVRNIMGYGGGYFGLSMPPMWLGFDLGANGKIHYTIFSGSVFEAGVGVLDAQGRVLHRIAAEGISA